MLQFREMIKKVLSENIHKEDRTGTGTLSAINVCSTYKKVGENFPLLTLKKTNFEFIKDELLWFLSGSNNINDLKPNTRMIWQDFANENGSLGKTYGYQFRKVIDNQIVYTNNFQKFKFGNLFTRYLYEKIDPFEKKNGVCLETKIIDQIKKLEYDIQNNPMSRRLMINLWNVGQLDDMNLPPCAFNSQFILKPLNISERYELYYNESKDECVRLNHEFYDNAGIPKYEISCILTQRSGDLLLGVPFNIASYSLLMILLAKTHNLTVGDLHHNIGDCHIYKNHLFAIDEILSNPDLPLPKVNIKTKRKSILDYTHDDIELIGYQSAKYIKLPIAV